MAAVWKFLPLLALLILFSIDCEAEFVSYKAAISLVTVDDCVQGANQTQQFYDATKMACADCSQQNTIQVASSDGLSCVCRPGYRYSTNSGGSKVTCEPCPANQVASSTGFNCVSCPNGYDAATQTCTPCASSAAISPERNLYGVPVAPRSCQACGNGTTANAGKDRCVKCTTTYPISADNPCCPTGSIILSGFCFPPSDFTGTTISDDQKYVIPRTTNAVSKYLQDNLLRAYAECFTYENSTACQTLSNMCVMTFYEYEVNNVGTGMSRACEFYLKLLQNENFWAPKYAPWLYYLMSDIRQKFDGDEVLYADGLTVPFTFEPESKLEYRVARYDLDGNFLGLTNVLNGRLQLCADTTTNLDAAYVFGTYYEQSCSMKAIDLWNLNKYPMEFMDPYLEITLEGSKQLYPIPVNILNYRSRDQGSDEINRGDVVDRLYFRRFFMVDNIGNIPTTGGAAEMVRYAQKIEINVQLHTDTNQGYIYPPALNIEYGSVSLADANAGASINIEFKVDYTYTNTNYKRDFRIAIGVLSTLGILYGGYKTWCWGKRSGRPNIDIQTIATFLFFAAGSLANVFFVVTFGMAFYWFIFFKRQSVVYLVHPTTDQLKDWLGLFGSAFALKLLEVGHLIFMQCIIDVFFIDWERSRGSVGTSAESTKTKEVPVSIWRTYFVANEWNEIQAVRKINKTFQVWAAVFFLVVVGFENTATKDPNGSVTKDASTYKAAYSHVYRYAVAVLVFLLIGIVQWIFFTFIYERFFEDKVRQFVDLCSMSNISVFIMSHAQYGYYIHGRSVHGKADTNMKEMFEMMMKEEDDMCGQRGLLPNTEQQTFAMALPRKLRQRYEAVLLPAQLESAEAASRMEQGGKGGRISGTAKEKQVEAYTTINRFFSAFIDRSLKDINYVIKDRSFMESIMDTEFDETFEKGVFYNDNGHSFDNVLFYGNEMTLLLFDMLTFCVTDLIFENFLIAGVITYLLSELLAFLRKKGSRVSNLYRPYALGSKSMDQLFYELCFVRRNNLHWSVSQGMAGAKRTLPTKHSWTRDSSSRQRNQHINKPHGSPVRKKAVKKHDSKRLNVPSDFDTRGTSVSESFDTSARHSDSYVSESDTSCSTCADQTSSSSVIDNTLRSTQLNGPLAASRTTHKANWSNQVDRTAPDQRHARPLTNPHGQTSSRFFHRQMPEAADMHIESLRHQFPALDDYPQDDWRMSQRERTPSTHKR